MGSTSESCKLAEELNANQDRISNLPSCLISHILSFLPTKNAVATSVLSTQWKYLWTLTTSLEFNYKNDGSVLQNPRADRSFLQTSFKKFMDRVLLYDRFPCLRKFILRTMRDYGEINVHAWVDFALRHNVEELALLLYRNPPMLPRSLFTCRTLAHLTLKVHVMMAHTEVSLPCLKFLHLSRFTFPDDHSITSFFSGCPVLEDLRINGCIGKCVRVVNISAPRLTTLEVGSLPAEHDTSTYNYKIVFDTPCLSDLSISDDIAQGYEFKVRPHLEQACITIAGTLEIRRIPLNDLLKGISKVEFLELEGDHKSTEEIIKSNYRLPTFQNLTRLEFRIDGYHYLPLLQEFLQSSPLLRTLTIRQFGWASYDPDYVLNWNPSEDVPKCLMFHLKLIEILNFNAHHLVMVEYFLKHAHVLEKLIVKTAPRISFAKKLIEEDELFTLPRASTACQFEILR